MSATLASPSSLSRQSIENLASAVARATEYYPEKDIISSVKKLGGRVSFKDFWESSEHTGSLVVRDIGNFEIYVPQHTTIERDRFTIAHELGHYILHCLYKKGSVSLPLVADRYGSGRVEWEANWFAAAYLMPALQFKKACAAHANNIVDVAEEFGVSTEAARVRAKTLGIQT